MLDNRFYLKKSVKIFNIWTNMKMCRLALFVLIQFCHKYSHAIFIPTGTFITLNKMISDDHLKQPTKMGATDTTGLWTA